MDLIENDPEIKKAHDKYEEFISDKELQDYYLAREMYQHDKASRHANAKYEGKQEIVISFFNNGFSIEKISEITGIDLETIEDMVNT